MCRRFIRGHAFNIDSAFRQYKLTRAWRDNNHLLDLYNSIDVNDYEETRKMVRLPSPFIDILLTGNDTVHTLDWPPRPRRHSHLLVRDRPTNPPSHGDVHDLLRQCAGETLENHGERGYATPVLHLRESDPFRVTSLHCYKAEGDWGEEAGHGYNVYCGYWECWVNAILAVEESYECG